MSYQEIEAGEKAPEFELKDHEDEKTNLSDFDGERVLLSFHPLAWTSVCRNQMVDLENNFQKFLEENVVPLGISIDPQPSKQAWAEELGLKNIRLLSDFWPHGETAKKYGIFRDKEGFSERANILIDEEGNIEFIKIYQLGERPDIEELLNLVKD